MLDMRSKRIPHAWAAALDGWKSHLRAAGRTETTITTRYLRERVALSADEWDAHVADVLDVCADSGRDDFAAWAREMGA